MNIPDHFLWVDRAAVISAWLEPLIILGCFVCVAVIVVAIALASDTSSKTNSR